MNDEEFATLFDAFTSHSVVFLRDQPALTEVGSQTTVMTQLESVALQYDTSDITIVSICHDLAARVRSHGLIAHALTS
jgi:hypothetical protein